MRNVKIVIAMMLLLSSAVHSQDTEQSIDLSKYEFMLVHPDLEQKVLGFSKESPITLTVGESHTTFTQDNKETPLFTTSEKNLRPLIQSRKRIDKGKDYYVMLVKEGVIVVAALAANKTQAQALHQEIASIL